jgi:hypothetical protein
MEIRQSGQGFQRWRARVESRSNVWSEMTKRVAGAARLGTRMGQASADAYSIDNGPGVKKMDRYPEDQRQRREEGSEGNLEI